MLHVTRKPDAPIATPRVGSRTLSRPRTRPGRLFALISLCGLGTVSCARAHPGGPPTPEPVPVATPSPPSVTADSAAAPSAPPRATSAVALLGNRVLMVPVDGIEPGKVRDSYNARRGSGIHASIDILAPLGTPVIAADDGRILKLRWNASGGITIYALDREERVVYYYAHLDAYRDGLREGAPVTQGDLLGFVGATGNAPKEVPHLHFQVMRYRGNGQWWAGEPVDARPFLQQRGRLR